MNEMIVISLAAVAFIGIATPGQTMPLVLTNGSRHGAYRRAAN